MNIPHDEIRDNEDRSWSMLLVDQILVTNDDDELDEIVYTLQALDDYRTVAPLTSFLENPKLGDSIRTAASDILADCNSAEETEQRRRAWWASGHPILMRHAIKTAERSEADLIEKIASEPSNPFHLEAIQKIMVRFKEPRFQELKVQALSHPDEEVRATAAEALLWDEPLVAEEPLLRAARDSHDEVAIAAAETLQYYGSQKVLIALNELRRTRNATRKKSFDKAFENIRETIQRQLEDFQQNKKATAHFRNWLNPVWDILEIRSKNSATRKKKNTTRSGSRSNTKIAQTMSDVFERFSNPDGKWAHTFSYFGSVDWESFSSEERNTLSKFFRSHADWSVRNASCLALAKWDMSYALLDYLDDPIFTVRKAAAYWICQVSQNQDIAIRLRELLEDDRIVGTYASEALESLIVHYSDDDLDDYLALLALEDDRESVRTKAISGLQKRKAPDHLVSLLPILSTPPLITWAVHHSLLDASVRLNIEVPQFEELLPVDDIHIQALLAELLSKKN